MKTLIARAGIAGIAALLLALVAVPASAHERRQSGDYTAVVGWAEEPAYTGFANAVEISLTDLNDDPVEDLGADELQVEVIYGDEQIGPLPLEPAFGSPGQYLADLIPTRPGTYSFHFTGAILGQPYDETFTSDEDTFASPRSPSEVGFPAQDPTNGELAESIEQLRTQLAADEDTGGSTAGPIGIALGAVALLVALGALLKARS